MSLVVQSTAAMLDGQSWIRAWDQVEISIGDSGTEIPAAIRHQVIARALIENHHRKLTFETEVGRGTTFHIRLPIETRGVTRRELTRRAIEGRCTDYPGLCHAPGPCAHLR